ncbi:MAG: hypothetical protein ACYCYR_09520 [Desulfobulbaceae bacterium]
MSAQVQQAKGLHIPPMFGELSGADNEIGTAVHVLTFLSETFADAKGEQPLTQEACFGLVLILDGLIETLHAAEAKL